MLYSSCWFVLQGLLSDRQRVLQLVLEEAQAVADKHGRPRRSRIVVGSSFEQLAAAVDLTCCDQQLAGVFCTGCAHPLQHSEHLP
jgi:hypothetical protein